MITSVPRNGQRPSVLPFNSLGVPAELRAIDGWIGWRLILRRTAGGARYRSI